MADLTIPVPDPSTDTRTNLEVARAALTDAESTITALTNELTVLRAVVAHGLMAVTAEQAEQVTDDKS